MRILPNIQRGRCLPIPIPCSGAVSTRLEDAGSRRWPGLRTKISMHLVGFTAWKCIQIHAVKPPRCILGNRRAAKDQGFVSHHLDSCGKHSVLRQFDVGAGPNSRSEAFGALASARISCRWLRGFRISVRLSCFVLLIPV